MKWLIAGNGADASSGLLQAHQQDGYLGGRFRAAYVLNALILIVLPRGMLAAILFPGRKPEIVGPFPPAVYLSAYGVLALATAFTFTSVQYSFVALSASSFFQLELS